MSPLVSVIIPCWNAQRFVGAAITSALEQTYSNCEVIVIDDGSTDGSLEVIQGFGDRVRWSTGPNRGGCAARNAGLEQARGELIQFLDADDILFPDKLEKSVPATLSAGLNAMVSSDWEVESEDPAEATTHQSLAYSDEDPVSFILARQMQTSSPLHWKRNLEAVGGFDESLPCSQERDLHLRLACSGVRLRYIPEALYRVRRQPGSVSSNFVRVLEQHRSIFMRAFRQLVSSGRMTDERRASFAAALARDGRLSVRHGRSDLALEFFREADGMLPGASRNAFRAPLLRSLAEHIGPINAERVCRAAVALGVRP